MRMSTRGRYGVRAMVELALNYEKGPLLLKDLAKKQEISPRYLDQLITPLRTAGLVKNIKGAGGGYTLAKHPSQITLGDVLHVLEGSTAFVDCVDDSTLCPRANICAIHDVWGRVKEAVDNIFDSLTLEEMIHQQLQKEGTISYDYTI
ncbi:MAG: RrF2 family transcriptional regulator [Thermodesulfobacteriota bacterium]|nr:RrF2 family transcriptional regulator [Thermodesulfobacteriota bacterium]